MINYLLNNLHEISKSIDIDEYAIEANYLIDFFKDGLGKKRGEEDDNKDIRFRL